MKIVISINADDVKNMAATLILSAYPIHRQLNLARTPGAELDAMTSYIDAVRASSKILLSMDQIPTDYQSPKHWPILKDIQT